MNENKSSTTSNHNNIAVKHNENAVEKRNSKIMFADSDKTSCRVDERTDYALVDEGLNVGVPRTPAC